METAKRRWKLTWTEVELVTFLIKKECYNDFAAVTKYDIRHGNDEFLKLSSRDRCAK
jgi:hypothetical protein